MGPGHVLRNHYPHPERWFERGLFRDLERRGFAYRELNALGEATVHYAIDDAFANADLAELLPGWCFWFIRKALKHIEPERLILTSDCGFGRQSMSRMHAFYKMVALTRGTNIVRRELGLEEAYIPATDKQLSMVPLGA